MAEETYNAAVQQAEFLEHVKQAVHEIAPKADIVLYGSRARSDAHAESDWDFLILLDGMEDDAHTDVIRHTVEPLDPLALSYTDS